MKASFIRLPVVFALMALASACSSTRSWVPDISMPDFSDWFSREHRILIYEVVNDSYCNDIDERISIELLAGPTAVHTWQASRHVDLLGKTELPNANYVAVDLGLRKSAGYGIAVSREAGIKNRVLVLKATTFAPKTADPPDQITSPCALVRLPDEIEFDSLKLIDQTGKVRASSLTTNVQ